MLSLLRFLNRKLITSNPDKNLRWFLLLIPLPIFYILSAQNLLVLNVSAYLVTVFFLAKYLRSQNKIKLIYYFRIGTIIWLWVLGLWVFDSVELILAPLFMILLDVYVLRSAADQKPDIRSMEQAGAYGEKLMQQKLDQMIGNGIDGYVSSGNMIVDNRNFEIDFLVMVPNFGFVIVEVKYYSGRLQCGAKEWFQEKKNGQNTPIDNASKQVLRTKYLLQKIMQQSNIAKWPILPVVVLTHPEVEVQKRWHTQAPQTDVIKLEMFQAWIQDLPRTPDIHFTKKDFDEITKMITNFEAEYREPLSA